MKKDEGYIILLLMFSVFLITIGLLVAIPVWQTQIQREKEEELIFRGKQYVEAVRLFQQKKPGAFPREFDELLEEKCIRRLYKDPMTEDGSWNVILVAPGLASRGAQPARQRTSAFGSRSRQNTSQTGRRARGSQASQSERGGGGGGGFSVQKVLIAPQEALSSIDNPQIIGVVSKSTLQSIKIYYQQESYDKWLFYYGQDPTKMPEIAYYGQKDKD
jgi:type II secretory pathway pseudopilin PulG